jgi:hypothetical protein
MRGFPKHIATKQDFINLLSIKDYVSQTLEVLRIIRDMDDLMTTRTISIDEITGEAETEQITNPMPMWKVKGFASRNEVADIVKKWEVK